MALNYEEVDNEVYKPTGRFKVRIRCNQCNEAFVLRGSYNSNGSIETGFKMCLCGNSEDVEINPID